MTPQKRKQIAYAYWNTKFSIGEIGKEHGISGPYASRIGRQMPEFRGYEPQPPKEKDMVVVKIPRDQLPSLEHILTDIGIEYETPECFELIEKYESKMNEL